jgi:hypothetical protein
LPIIATDSCRPSVTPAGPVGAGPRACLGGTVGADLRVRPDLPCTQRRGAIYCALLLDVIGRDESRPYKPMIESDVGAHCRAPSFAYGTDGPDSDCWPCLTTCVDYGNVVLRPGRAESGGLDAIYDVIDGDR